MLIQLCLATTLTAGAMAQTVHSVLVFTRHGDRTAKFYPGYSMTNLGANQVYSSGSFYRERYVANGASNQIAGISPDRVVANQIWASAPDQGILYQTATNFLQGLYPPLGELNSDLAIETLVNGTSVEGPLNGYQYILIHGEGNTDPDTIWLKGDDSCPAYTTSYKSYAKTPFYKATLNASAPLYSSVEPILGPIMGSENVSYSHAYDVFDLLNVASIHNTSVGPSIEPSTLSQLRYLANEFEYNNNYNATQPMRSVGGMTLAGGILHQLNASVSSEARRQKFSLLAGSYDTFLAFFGITNLTTQSDSFYGLPNYAASMVFELFSESDSDTFPANPTEDLYVRFLFRNGSDSDQALTAYPLFGQDELALPWGRFVTEISTRAVTSLGEWCALCGSEEDFCVAANASSTSASDSRVSSSAASGSGSSLSNTAAGAIGAVVALAVAGIIGVVAWLLVRRGRTRRNALAREHIVVATEKRMSDSESTESMERV